MSFGPSVTELTAGQVTAATIIPLSKASAQNQIQSGIFLTELIAVGTANAAILAALSVVASNANFPLGAATVGTSGTGVIAVPTGVAPTTAPADEFQLYSKDYEATAGDARAHVKSETGNTCAIGNGTFGVPKPAATTGASVAGRSVTLKPGDAVASTDTNGAAAGGDVLLPAGAAARLVSGNAAGGNVIATPGAGIGTGAAGNFVVRQPGGTPGTNELQINQNGTNAICSLPQVALWFNDSSGASRIAIDPNGGTAGRVQSRRFSLVDQPQNFLTSTRGFLDWDQKFFRGTSDWLFAWTSSTTDALNTADDTSLARVVAGVVKAQGASSAAGWLQSPGGHKTLDANQTSVSDTLASTNLTWTLKAGRSYSIKLKISGGNSTAAEGAKFALTADGTLTATTFDLAVVGSNGTDVAGTTRVTSLGSAINYTTFTATSDLYLVGEIKCNVAGVMTLQMATNAHSAGTLTLNAGSWGELNDMLAV